MKKLFIYILFFSLFSAKSQQLKIEAVLLNTYSIDADFFVGRDGFGTTYYTKSNVLFKNNENVLMQYQNISLGKITKVDITNPLKIILFYEEFNSIIVLDNQLNEIQKVDFSKLEIPVLATAVGISAQNQVWVFNSLNQQIGLYDLNSNAYKNLGIPINDAFQYYQTDFNYFNWINKERQWMTCTIFGRFNANGKVELAQKMMLLDTNKTLFLMANELFLKDIASNTIYKIEIVEKTFADFYYKDQILSIFTNKEITNYKIVIP